MIQIAVVEDNTGDFSQLKLALTEFFQQRETACRITRYADAETFLQDYQSQFDLLFLDIDLPGMDGIRAAKELRKTDTSVALVFLTNLSRFAINGYEVNAADYLLKPIDTYSLALKMPKVLRMIENNIEKTITITTKNSVHRFAVSQILYVEVAAHQLSFHTEHGTYTSRGSMKEIEATLEQHHFRRCNNCYLVNLMHVTGIQDNTVLVGGEALAISRPKKKYFINELTNFLGGTP